MTETKRTTARGIVATDGNILLMERWRDGQHYFSIPGGGVEGDESLEAALHRELAEETGIEVAVVRSVLVYDAPDATHHIFLCDYVSGEPALHAGSPEALESAKGKNIFKPGWVELDLLPNIPLKYWEPLRNALIDGLEQGFADGVKTITI